MTIGRSPEWSVTVARERAKELRHAIDKGQDPLSVKDDLREAPRVKDMIDRYIAEHLPKLAKSNAADQVSMLKKHAGTGLGQQAVAEITMSDVARFFDVVADGVSVLRLRRELDAVVGQDGVDLVGHDLEHVLCAAGTPSPSFCQHSQRVGRRRTWQ